MPSELLSIKRVFGVSIRYGLRPTTFHSLTGIALRLTILWWWVGQGYGATLLSFGPFSAFYFLFYEKVGGIAY